MNRNGVLTDETATYAPEFLTKPTHARDLLIIDFDNDGWKDVVFANTFNQIPYYYRNQGNDSNGDWLGLIDETATRFPIRNSLDDVPLICAVKAEDIDNDGDLDIYFVNYKQNSGGGIAKDFLYINNGSAVFTEEAQTRLGNLRNSAFGTEVELKDIDNDGDKDIIKVSALYTVTPWNTRGTFILYNNGNGSFTNWQEVTSNTSNTSYMIDIEDFNGDGQLDIYIVDDSDDWLLTSDVIVPDNNISFTTATIPFNYPNLALSRHFGGNVHSADFDLDGDLDIAVADVDVDMPPCNSGRSFVMLRNDGGTFSRPYTYNEPWSESVYDFAILDINNDGLQDLIVGLCNGYKVWISDNCLLAPINSDFDQDGIADACDPCPANPDPNCQPDLSFPIVDMTHTISRQWNELLLASIRRDLARPTVHARNLFHHSAAMWDVYNGFKKTGNNYLVGNTLNGYTCNAAPFVPTDIADTSIAKAISFLSYRLLSHRFQNSANYYTLSKAYDYHMTQLGYDISNVSIDYSTGDAAAFGNFVAQCYINYGLQDNSNEINDYNNLTYTPINPPLVVDYSGNPDIIDLDKWQPLTLDIFIDQSGNIIPGATPAFLSPEWGNVYPFAMTAGDATTTTVNGSTYKVYHDPSSPPLHTSSEYKWGFEMVSIWSSHLDPADGVQLDISPKTLGSSAALPSTTANYSSFYDLLDGGTTNIGHSVNPSTNAPYADNTVPRGDFTRVLAEFWADGPDSETPPGHWFTILNELVSDHPSFEKKFEGEGTILSDLEWDVKSYFALGGAMHDAAVTAWSIKGRYDYIRPISAIRAMADLGQSSDPSKASYHPNGITLLNGYIELVEVGDALAGDGDVNVGKIKLKSWLGHDVINNVDVDNAGVGWILAENWMPYQRPSFVTPNFAGYVSGHSTFSSAAAVLLSRITGDDFFPGGLGTFTAEKDEFLVFENGPSQDIELQWATYEDAAYQSALSRIWGGIHPPADDIPGRKAGKDVGADAFDKAKTYFELNATEGEVQHGTFTFATANSNEWDYVAFDEPFDKVPVVVAGPPSYNGGDPGNIRIKDITTDGFYVQFDEWDYSDGSHTTETISYLAAIEGVYTLGDITLVAGKKNDIDHTWQNIDYTIDNGLPNNFVPSVVIASQTTNNESDATAIRFKNLNATSFDIRLQEQETNNGTPHAGEEVSYMVFSSGAGNIRGKKIKVGNFVRNHSFGTANFGTSFNRPHLYGNIQTYNGYDPAALRYRNLTSTSVQFKVEEERSANNELAHTNEQIGYVVIEGGDIQYGNISFATANSNEWDYVSFEKSFKEVPIVVAGPPSYNVGDPGTIRIKDITTDGFYVQFDEWDYKDGGHTTETVSYFAATSGIHTLGDLTMIAKKISAIDHNWSTIDYASGIALPSGFNPSVVLASQTSNNDNSATTIRLNNLSVNNFDIRLQEEEANDDIHASEEVNYMVFTDNTGAYKGDSIKVGNISVNHGFKKLDFGIFTENPEVFANTQTFGGGDPCAIRYRNLTSSTVQFKLEEERSANTELRHVYETVGYVIVGQSTNTTTKRSVINNDDNQEDFNEADYTAQNHIKLYPNPAKDFIIGANLEEHSNIAIYNSLGQLLNKFENMNSDNYKIDTSQLEAGFYIMTIESGNTIISKKFIKE